LPQYGTNHLGDLICVVHIVMPKSINDKDEKYLKKLKDSSNFKV